MPQVTVYIRNEDIELWKNVQNKSQWMHDRLRGGTYIKEGDNIPIQETPKNIVEPKFLQFCKHGSAPQFCKHASPGKPCKK